MARDTLNSHTKLEKLYRKVLNYIAKNAFTALLTFLPCLLSCQLAYEPSKTDYLTDWMHTMSLALPLRTRLDDITLNLISNPHQRPKFSHQQNENSGLEVQKRVRGHLSPEIGDRWRLCRVVSHSHIPHHDLTQLT